MKPPPGNSDLVASLPVQLLTAGTAACIADLATFPLDTAKVRLQIQGEILKSKPAVSQMHVSAQNFSAAQIRTITTAPLVTSTTNGIITPQYRGLVGTISTITRQEGPRALYNGLSAGLQRQMCFASVRLGLYDTIKEYYGSMIQENPQGLQIFTRVLAGITTGGAAVLLGQPTDVVKVRFQAQSRSTSSTIPRYRTITGAYRTIYRNEGVKGLWKGTMPNVSRNAIVNVTEIVCYDVIKDCLMLYGNMKDNIYCHFSAAFFAGLLTTVASSPVDVIKTRYMNSPSGTYKSSIDCTIQMFRNEGAAAFYKGFTPNFARMLSWNLVLWITYEQIKKVTYHKREN